MVENNSVQGQIASLRPHQALCLVGFSWARQDEQIQMRISWDNSDRIFVVEVPELPGCMAHAPHGANRSPMQRTLSLDRSGQETVLSVPGPNMRGLRRKRTQILNHMFT